MENVWITTAEVAVEPGDMPSGDTRGFTRITMWASSHEDFVQKLEAYLSKYSWKLLSMADTATVDPSKDYGDEVNQIIDETLQDRNAIRLGTYYSYKPNWSSSTRKQSQGAILYAKKVKLGPSGKPMIQQKDFSTEKKAKDAANAAGLGPPMHHPSPARVNPTIMQPMNEAKSCLGSRIIITQNETDA